MWLWCACGGVVEGGRKRDERMMDRLHSAPLTIANRWRVAPESSTTMARGSTTIPLHTYPLPPQKHYFNGPRSTYLEQNKGKPLAHNVCRGYWVWHYTTTFGQQRWRWFD